LLVKDRDELLATICAHRNELILSKVVSEGVPQTAEHQRVLSEYPLKYIQQEKEYAIQCETLQCLTFEYQRMATERVYVHCTNEEEVQRRAARAAACRAAVERN
jgi:hypothetical protein